MGANGSLVGSDGGNLRLGQPQLAVVLGEPVSAFSGPVGCGKSSMGSFRLYV